MLQNLFNYRQSPIAFREQSRVKTITSTELHQRLSSSKPPLVVDVRTPEEYAQDGHIAGSRLLPLSTLRQRKDELPKDQPIIFVCRSGNRSHLACEQLANWGFTDVTNLVGGMIDWRRSGLPSR
jgi:rhodanese-related sulfurtransferase